MKTFSMIAAVIVILLAIILIFGSFLVHEVGRSSESEDVAEVLLIAGIGGVLWGIVWFIEALLSKREEVNRIESKYAVLVARQPSISPKPFARCSVPAVFQLRDGRYIHLMLDASSTLLVGDQGILSWRREEFLQFDKIRFS